MKYKLQNVKSHEEVLFFAMPESQGDPGCIGYLRGDFGPDGTKFYSTWFDVKGHLKTKGFQRELDRVINFLREDFEYPVLKSLRDMKAHFHFNPNDRITMTTESNEYGFRIRTQQCSYYFRCVLRANDYNFYVSCYDNEKLDLFLETIKPLLPDYCFSTMPHIGDLVIIRRGEPGYHPNELSVNDPEHNRAFADDMNRRMGVSKAEEAALVAGSMFGWDVSAANPNNYDENGLPLSSPE